MKANSGLKGLPNKKSQLDSISSLKEFDNTVNDSSPKIKSSNKPKNQHISNSNVISADVKTKSQLKHKKPSAKKQLNNMKVILDDSNSSPKNTLDAVPKLERKRKQSSEEDMDTGPEMPPKKTKTESPEEFGLFIHNVPNTAQMCDVKESFKNFGQISRVVLPLERLEKGASRSNCKNKGFAFVKFCSEEARNAALAHKNHEINGHLLRVKAERSKLEQGTTDNKGSKTSAKETDARRGHSVFVSNIRKGVPCEELEEHFTQFGDVSNVIVCPAHAKLKKPFAQVVFSSAHAKAQALFQSKQKMGDVTLIVGATKTDVLGTDARGSVRSEHELFVAQLSRSTSTDTLHKHFSKYGTITKIFQPRCPKTNRPKQCAFVAFESEKSVKAALEEDHEIDMSLLLVRDSKVDIGKKKEPLSHPTLASEHSLFVARVPRNTTKETLITYFSKYGEVTDVRLAWDPIKRCTKSYGEVYFSSAHGLQAALSETHKIAGTEIFVKRNERKTAATSQKSSDEQGRNTNLHSDPSHEEDDDSEEEEEEESSEEEEEDSKKTTDIMNHSSDEQDDAEDSEELESDTDDSDEGSDESDE